MSTLAAFEVVGLPIPQGSKTRMPNGAMLDGKSAKARENHKSWRSAVAHASREMAEDDPHDGALHLTVTFRLPMPASRPKTVRVRGWGWKTTTPDLDKLVRALCDGLTEGGLIRDDARIVKMDVEKIEVIGWTGAQISLLRVPSTSHDEHDGDDGGGDGDDPDGVHTVVLPTGPSS